MGITVNVERANLLNLAASTSGPIRLFWLRFMANADRTAKLLLSNDMVNVRTGNLRSSQQAPSVVVTPELITGEMTNIAKYAKYVHDGTKPHEIRAKKSKLLTGWTYAGAPVFTPLVHHPGTKARPWMLTAVRQTMSEMFH